MKRPPGMKFSMINLTFMLTQWMWKKVSSQKLYQGTRNIKLLFTKPVLVQGQKSEGVKIELTSTGFQNQLSLHQAETPI